MNWQLPRGDGFERRVFQCAARQGRAHARREHDGGVAPEGEPHGEGAQIVRFAQTLACAALRGKVRALFLARHQVLAAEAFFVFGLVNAINARGQHAKGHGVPGNGAHVFAIEADGLVPGVRARVFGREGVQLREALHEQVLARLVVEVLDHPVRIVAVEEAADGNVPGGPGGLLAAQHVFRVRGGVLQIGFASGRAV